MSLAERVWKYTALGGSSIIGEETNPIIGGIAARHGRLDFLAVVVSVAIGTWLASIALYYIGRWRIDWVRARWPDKQRALDGALEIVSRHPWRASLAVRFAYGLRLPLPIACGAARLPISLYVIATGVSCWIWSLAFTYLGLAAGGAALALLAFTHRLDVRLGVLALVLLVILFFFVRRRRIAERTAKVLSGGEDIPIMTTAERSAAHRPRPGRVGTDGR
jgi:membrane protein DedA with SNARE-associated domain